MKPLWAIQKFACNDYDSKDMISVFKDLDLPFQILEIPAFDYDNIQKVNYDGPVIPYGGTKFIDAIKNDDGWFCVFNDNFKYSIAVQNLGNRMFNADGRFMKMRDFCPSMYKDQKHIFIRPDKDIKEFAGAVLEVEEFMAWRTQIDGKGWGVNEETEILVSSASRVDEEWRTYVVNGEVIDASRYRKDTYLSISHDVPESVYEYARETIKIWQPAPFFVLDVCRVNDTLHVLEIGDLHSAGWYDSDKKLIIKTVSEYVENETINKR